MLVAVYEIYDSIPTKLERMVREHGHAHDEPAPAKTSAKRAEEPRTSWS
jgi:hypothetical protein